MMMALLSSMLKFYSTGTCRVSPSNQRLIQAQREFMLTADLLLASALDVSFCLEFVLIDAMTFIDHFHLFKCGTAIHTAELCVELPEAGRLAAEMRCFAAASTALTDSQRVDRCAIHGSGHRYFLETRHFGAIFWYCRHVISASTIVQKLVVFNVIVADVSLKLAQIIKGDRSGVAANTAANVIA